MSTTGKLRFYRIGSDPELVFGRSEEWSAVITSAQQVIGSNREVMLNTFIGTDGHTATGELRPPPAHNIRRHLYDVAFALDKVDSWCKKHKKFNDLLPMAGPWVANEPLGGHIHISVLYDDIRLSRATELNYTFSEGQWVALDPARRGGQLSTADVRAFESYAADVHANKAVLTDRNFSTVLNHLLLPLEFWVQPWHSRRLRNSRYGGIFDLRKMASPRPTSPKFAKHAYVHYEYRVPSSWLQHPAIAYAYLALAKLCVLNFHLIQGRLAADHKMIDGANAKAQNEEARELLSSRLEWLSTNGGRRCADLCDLPKVLDLIARNRAEWVAPNTPIAIDAWRKLL